MRIMQAFAEEAAAVQGTVDGIEGEAWTRAALGDWTVAELVAHLVRAADRITEYLGQPLQGTVPACDRVGYFAFDMAGAAGGVMQRSRDDAVLYGTPALPEVFAGAWRATVEATAPLEPHHLIQTFRGPMHLEEYAATRVLELVVHHLDLRRALGLRPATTPSALDVTAGILDGLLDGDRPEGLDTATFVLAATGREAHPDPRLPVIS